MAKRDKKSATANAPSAKRPGRGRSSRGASLKEHCRSLPHTTEDVKWGDDLVFSVGGKMYAAFDLDDEDEFAFKCDEMDFERLTRVEGVIPAPYAARFGWVKVMDRKALAEREWRALISKAYEVVRAGLPAGVRKRMAE